MAFCKVKEIPKFIKKLGDGEYRFKIKGDNVIIASKQERYEDSKKWEELKKEG